MIMKEHTHFREDGTEYTHVHHNGDGVAESHVHHHDHKGAGHVHRHVHSAEEKRKVMNRLSRAIGHLFYHVSTDYLFGLTDEDRPYPCGKYGG